MGRNKGSRTGVIETVPATCQQCNIEFRVLGKHRPDGPRPAKFCSHLCYSDSKRGIRPSGFIAKPGGAPKGREPWNKGRTCQQLAGERNGMHGRTHTPETRARLSAATSAQLSELTRQRIADAQAPLLRSDPLYSKLFRVGWQPMRKKAIQRDGRRCQVCGARNHRMEVHHIVPFSVVVRHELSNLITLCSGCHSAVHRGAFVLVAATDAVPVH